MNHAANLDRARAAWRARPTYENLCALERAEQRYIDNLTRSES